VFQSCKNFWKIRRVAKTDCTGKQQPMMIDDDIASCCVFHTCYCCSWRSEEKLGVGCVYVPAVLGSRSEENLEVVCVCVCVCVCVLVLGSPSSSCSSKQPPTTTTRKRRAIPQVTTIERESQKRGAETSRRT
jgi:hypothetical protein